MELTHITRNEITVTISVDELVFLCNAINEALEAVEDWEFQTRTGNSRKRATEILGQLRKVLDEAQAV